MGYIFLKLTISSRIKLQLQDFYYSRNNNFFTKQEQKQPELYAKNVQLLMAKALEIPATDITYKKYYAEYCAMYGTQLSADDTDKIHQEDAQAENGSKGILGESSGNHCDGTGKAIL